MNIPKIRDMLAAQDSRFVLCALLVPPDGKTYPLSFVGWISETVVAFKKLDSDIGSGYIVNLSDAYIENGVIKLTNEDQIMMIKCKNLC